MRFLLFLFSVTGFAQTSLIGVNSAAAVLKAGARDVVTAIAVDPSAAGGDLLAVMLMAEGVKVEIELPNKRRVTQANAAAGGFQWDVVGQGQGDELLMPGAQGKVNHLILLPPTAPAGKYLIHADASGLREDSGLMVTFLPVGEDSARVAVDSTEKLYYAGDRVELFAGVFEGSRGIDNAQLTGVASLIDSEGMPKGPPMPVEFKFVGQGNYRAEFPTTVAGKYEVGLKVRGKYANGREFERGAGTSVEIRLRWAKIVSLTEQPVDEDGNGLIDRIEVTAQVQVDLAGEYSVQVDLFAAGANMQAYGKAKLEKGQGTITAIVGRYPLTHVAVDGPYKMSARLFRNGPDGEGFASLLENAGETRVYERSTFDRGPIYFPGTFSAAPKAAAGDGRMNQLVVSLDVFTPGGSCSWGGSLRNGRINIGNFYDRAELPKGPGKVDLVFDGIDISAAADGQPLQLGHFGITCGKVQAASEKDLDLPNFPAGTFAKAKGGFELTPAEVNILMNPDRRGSAFSYIEAESLVEPTAEFSFEGAPEGMIVTVAPDNNHVPTKKRLVWLMVTADPTVATGSYTVTAHAKYQGEERTQRVVIELRR